jgi:hypothetical protein
MALRSGQLPIQQTAPGEQAYAVTQETLDRHYRGLLDTPIATLENQSPRTAAQTPSGREKLVKWLKMLENLTAKSGDHDRAFADYSFGWLWEELGVSELRK